MQHSFDVEIAKEYGVLEAILINNFQFWIEKNKANNANYYNGCFWTYNTTKALTELLPYASEKQIRASLKNLIEKGIICTARFNDNPMNRTLWYAFTEKGNSILQNRKLQFTNKENVQLPKKEDAISQMGSCINNTNNNYISLTDNKHTDINTDNKHTDNSLLKEKNTKKEKTFENVLESIEDERLKTELLDYIEMRNTINAPLTLKELETNIQLLFKLSNNTETLIEIVNQSTTKKWKKFYPLKKPNEQPKPRLAF